VFVKREERDLARHLRRVGGLPIREIAARVGVSVGSVSVWVRDIELTAEQQAALDARNPARNAQVNGAASNSRRCRAERAAAQAHGRELARAADPLHIKGCMLHWAEGSKRRNSVTFTNSDDAVVALFLRFLRSCYGVTDDRITFSVNCFLGNGLTIDAIHAWWLQRLALPDSCLRTPAINRVSIASKRLKGHVLPYGTARLAVHSTFIVQSIYGAIQEYAGIDRPEWLDL
jgi:AcrR family transcriptional regulator